MTKKISELTQLTTPASDDIIPLVDVSDTTMGATGTTKYIERDDLIRAPFNSMSRQAIINGNFDIWQRGTSFSAPASLAYTADRYKVEFTLDGGTAPTLTHTRQVLTSGDIPNSFFHYRVATNGAGTSYGNSSEYCLEQLIENGVRNLCGLNKKVTLSFWARSSIANKKLGVYLEQRYGSGGSPTATEGINGTNWTLTSAWTKYEYTFTTNTLVGKTFGTSYNDALNCRFYLQWGSTIAARVGDTVAESFVGSGNIDIAQVQLNAGDEALEFNPKSYAQELADCQRYFQVLAGESGAEIYLPASFYADANAITYAILLEKAMRTAPVITYIGTANTHYGVSQNGVMQSGFTFTYQKSTKNSTVLVSNKTSHGLTAGVSTALAINNGGAVHFSSEI